MKKTKKYNYYMSYYFEGGFGGCDVTTEWKIDSAEKLYSIRNMIQEDCEKQNITKNKIVIISYQLLNEEYV